MTYQEVRSKAINRSGWILVAIVCALGAHYVEILFQQNLFWSLFQLLFGLTAAVSGLYGGFGLLRFGYQARMLRMEEP